jgi:ABC-type phosphate transport system substrate-binding protein
VESGLGIAFIPSISWGNLFSDNVVFKKVSNTKRYTYTYVNTKKYTPTVIQKFLEVLKATSQNVKQSGYNK